MNRITLAIGLLAMAAVFPVSALTPAFPAAATQDAPRDNINTATGVALAALLSNDLMLRVSVDNNNAAKQVCRVPISARARPVA
jgi:hexosaminidase